MLEFGVACAWAVAGQPVARLVAGQNTHTHSQPAHFA